MNEHEYQGEGDKLFAMVPAKLTERRNTAELVKSLTDEIFSVPLRWRV